MALLYEPSDNNNITAVALYDNYIVRCLLSNSAIYADVIVSRCRIKVRGQLTINRSTLCKCGQLSGVTVAPGITVLNN